MSISRANGSGWGIGDTLTSAQANAIDTNTTYAVDKRSGQTDTIQSVVTCSGAGRIIPSYTAGADADTTYALSGGISIINATTLTANRIYTLSTTGASAGDTVTILNTSSSYDLTVKVSSTTLLVIGAGNTGANQSRWGEFLFTGSTWILFRSSLPPQQQRTTFTSNGTYTVPADCYKLIVVGVGGGGGGGGGSGGYVGTTLLPCGGGGGGGAMLGVTWVDTTPGATFSVTVGTGGSGGSGGAANSAGNSGADGGNTTFGSTLTFYGAQGGVGGPAPSSMSYIIAPGGGPVGGGVKAPAINGSALYQLGTRLPGEGGYSSHPAATGSVYSAAGMYPNVSSTVGGSGTTSGGAAGNVGTTNYGSYKGGAGGGGGGASALGNGGAGGDGGPGDVAPNTTPSAYAGSAGGTGAGGGGGGARGQHDTAAGQGAIGGAGGNGALIVIPVR